MKIGKNAINSLAPGPGSNLSAEILSRLNIEEYLDQLGRAVALAAGERQRLGELLAAVEYLASTQHDEALSEQGQEQRQLARVLTDKAVLTQREKDVINEYRRRQSDVAPISGEFALGNILVANGQITRAQLESALLRQETTGRRLGHELITAGHADKGQIEGGLLLQRKLISWALAVTVGLVPLAAITPQAEAAQARADMPVSVSVIANARMQTAHQTTQLRISAADVARGYVDVPAASRFSVTTNSRAGYRIEFHPLGDYFEWVHVAGLGNDVRLGADGGTIVQRGPLPPNLTHELSFRFTLRPGTLPGTYPWPLLLSVRALS